MNEDLWSYRLACHGLTKVSPYQLVYGHDAVLPWEIKTGSRRVCFQDQLTADDYAILMKDESDDFTEHWLRALMSIEENKKRVAKWYDKKVKVKEFVDGDLVWKLILPIGTKNSKVGKWSLLGILNIITKSRLSFLILVTVPKMPNLSIIPLKPSCHPQHDMRDAVLKYAIALLNK